MTQAGQIMVSCLFSISNIPLQKKQFSFDDNESLKDDKFRRYLENTLKIHQLFALVDVDYTQVFGFDKVASASAETSQ